MMRRNDRRQANLRRRKIRRQDWAAYCLGYGNGRKHGFTNYTTAPADSQPKPLSIGELAELMQDLDSKFPLTAMARRYGFPFLAFDILAPIPPFVIDDRIDRLRYAMAGLKLYPPF